MGLTDKVSELANYFSNNFDKVKELPTSLAGSITSAATAVPKAPMFSQSSAKEDDPYPNMIRTIEDMLDTITEGNAYDKFKPQLRPKVDPFKDIRPKERPTVKETSTTTTATKEPKGLIEKPKAFELNSIPREIFSKKGGSYSLSDTDIDIMARTIAAEAQGESLKGQIGVGYVILNRTLSKWQGKDTVTEIIKSPYQFSVWNKNSKVDPNAIKPDDDSYKTALKVIEGITSSKYKDPTGGASYYWNPNVAERKSWMSPAEKENKLTIGKHTFAGLASNPFKYIYKPLKRQ
jgi:spore germination cell wall hydrolase CwlJ-like protein